MLGNLFKIQGKDLAYWERNQLVLYLSKIFPSWVEHHPKEDENWDKDWKNIIFIQFPEGLFSWHIYIEEMSYFEHLNFRKCNSWNGETLEQKYEMLRNKCGMEEQKKD